VEAEAGARLAARVALAADGLARQRLQLSLLLRPDPLVEVAVGTRLVLVQTALHVDVAVDDGFLTRNATRDADRVLGAGAAVHAVVVARHALVAGRLVLAVGTRHGAERAVAHVLAARATARTGTCARVVALGVARFARLVVRLVNSAIKKEMHISQWAFFVSRYAKTTAKDLILFLTHSCK
jgi:hypothetical protein